MRTGLGQGLLEALGGAALALGCSVSTADDPETAGSGITNALVTIERSAAASSPDAVRAEAFAGFLRLPPEVEAGAVLPIAGVARSLPPAGECKKLSRQPGEAVPADELAQVELLDAGEVTLAAGGVVTTLAPRAFPSVTEAISGVVYTTRDRAAEPLPAGVRYALATSGSGALGAISVDLLGPATLAAVTVSGTPLGETEALPEGRALELRWDAGAAGDLVYVAVESDGASSVCVYRDEAGRGTLPSSVLPAPGPGSLTFHRLRATPFSDVGLSRGELRFDFELSRPVVFE